MKRVGINATLLGFVLLTAGAAFAVTECFQPTSWPPTNNFGAGTCYDCFQGVRGAGKSFGNKIIGAVKNTTAQGGATVTYVIGMNYSGGVDTPVPSCFVNAKVISTSTLAACSLIADSDYSKTAAGVCNSANHWYLDSHN